MTGKIVLGLVGTIVIGTPIILLNLGVLGTMAQVETAITGETDVPQPVAQVGIGVADAFGRFAEGQSMATLFDPDLLARARHVLHKQTVTIDDVLGPDEARPAPGLEKLWITARANSLAMPECDRVLATIAKTCGVSKSEVKESDDGTFSIESMLSYVPSYYLGEAETGRSSDLYTRHVEIPAERSERRITNISRLPALREEYYAAAKQACRELRRETQNCVVSKIEPELRDIRGEEGAYTYHVRVTMNYVGPRAEGSNESLLGKLASHGAGSAEEVEERGKAIDALSGFLGGGGSGENEEPAPKRPPKPSFLPQASSERYEDPF